MNIEVDGVCIEIHRKAVKNINLRIYPPDGRVRISVPVGYKEHLIYQHIKEKMPWIHSQRSRLRTMEHPAETALETGASVTYLGKNYLVLVEEHHGPAKIILNGHMLHCYIPANMPQANRQQVLERWYKQRMQELLPNIISYWQGIIGVQALEWGIKAMKTRWGSCNTRAKRIWLNVNLMKKPLVCLEYVVVHELVHLLEASHNQRFYALMTRFMPQWKEHQVVLEGSRRSKL